MVQFMIPLLNIILYLAVLSRRTKILVLIWYAHTPHTYNEFEGIYNTIISPPEMAR